MSMSGSFFYAPLCNDNDGGWIAIYGRTDEFKHINVRGKQLGYRKHEKRIEEYYQLRNRIESSGGQESHHLQSILPSSSFDF